jgi:hypothetical protein
MKRKDLLMHERMAYLKKTAVLYQKGNKSQKGQYLNIVCEMTGYNRKYAIHLLANWDKITLVRMEGKLLRLKAGTSGKKRKRKRDSVYTPETQKAVKSIWKLYEYPCSRRLKAILERDIEYVRGLDHFMFPSQTWIQLSQISRSTIDRILKKEREKYRIKGNSHTKPGSLLKSQIPVRTFADWNEKQAGYFEVDLVGHDGGTACGEYNYTLNATDIHTGWTESFGLLNRAQKWTHQAIEMLRNDSHFPLKGIDSDNGSEFINNHLTRYCIKHNITFTRSRPYKKNDNCYVEQKNNDLVRRYVGYARYDSSSTCATLNQLYRVISLFYNFFQPQAHLISKARIGSKVKKVYDAYRTPYQRVLDDPSVSDEVKQKLKNQFHSLNIIELRKEIDSAQNKLLRQAV